MLIINKQQFCSVLKTTGRSRNPVPMWALPAEAVDASVLQRAVFA
jgi:hypothetical protein